MLIHVEANQFFPNSIQIIHDVQANQFFLDSIQIVQNGRERQDLLYTKGLRTRDDPQRYKTRSRPPYPDSSFPFFFSRVAACNQPKFRAVNQYSTP